MFTGVIEEIGTVRHVEPTPLGMRIEIASSRVVEDLRIDSTVNVSGARLVVRERDARGFAVDLAAELAARTTLGRAIRGTRVNLERAATATTALDGHLVQGQIDATAKVGGRRDDGGRLRLSLPKTIERLVMPGGFIAIDGVSLVIASLGKTSFEVAVSTQIADRTTLGALEPGELVNVEADVIAKYVRRLARRP